MKENGENIYKKLNAWLKNCRSFLAFIKKEIKYSIFMNIKKTNHTLECRTFFVITFAKK